MNIVYTFLNFWASLVLCVCLFLWGGCGLRESEPGYIFTKWCMIKETFILSFKQSENL